MRVAVGWLSLVTVLACGCEHPDPYVVTLPTDGDSLTGNFPRRLTYDAGTDLAPGFTPDGRFITYAFRRADSGDTDRCLAWIPPDGGRRARQYCWSGPVSDGGSDVVTDAAVSAGGSVAVMAASGLPGAVSPRHRYLVLAPASAADSARVLLTFPLLRPDGTAWFGARNLTWLGDSLLAFVPVEYDYPGSPPDTVENGLGVASLDLRGGGTLVSTWPAAAGASSIGTGPAAGTLLFTLNGDTRVLTLDAATGASTPLYDFDTLGVARDAQLVQGMLVTVVGGKVSQYLPSGATHLFQRDEGGAVISLRPADGSFFDQLPLAERFYRHIRAAPTGYRFVAEGYPVTIVPLFQRDNPPPPLDTTVTHAADVMLFQLRVTPP